MANRRTTVRFPVFNNYEVRVILSRDVRATCRRLQVAPDCLACFIPNGKRGHLVLPVDVDAGTIAHEASHVIQHLFSFVGARRDDETFAYHLDYLVSAIDSFSKKRGKGMKYTIDGLHITEQFEGCKLVAYQDSKCVWTIGYGHTHGVYPGMTCTQAQADAWLQEDVTRAEGIVNRVVKVPVTQHEFNALVDFEFNTGHLPGSTMLRLLNAGNHLGAAGEFEKWDKAGGVELAGLLRRRKAEKAEFIKT